MVRSMTTAPEARTRRQDTDPALYINRELSWLDFNARVLALARDPGVPLLERCKFLAIFTSNLDEFFMVRVATVQDALEARPPALDAGQAAARAGARPHRATASRD